MEYGSNGPLSMVEVSESKKNGVVSPIMANFPEGTVAVSNEEKKNTSETAIKLNGDTHTKSDILETEKYSSESDTLVIDESVVKSKSTIYKKRVNKPKSENIPTESETEVITHSNPYFNESLFELSQLSQLHQAQTAFNPEINTKVLKNKRGKTKPKRKLQEYAQYLGLQPTVQFRCSKCGLAGFETLTLLNEHISKCNSTRNNQETTNPTSGSGFKLTRKVFLCSSCGTYYENWNLYIHMLEIHRRYICLYCLGMFSVLEGLCEHIQNKHSVEPGQKNSLEDFYKTYNEPCYLVCVECNKVFTEQDNFYYHNCIPKSKGKQVKPQITPVNHVTGDSTTTVAQESINNSEVTAKDLSDNIVSTVTEDKVKQELTETCDENIEKSPEVDENIEKLTETEESVMTGIIDTYDKTWEEPIEENQDSNLSNGTCEDLKDLNNEEEEELDFAGFTFSDQENSIENSQNLNTEKNLAESKEDIMEEEPPIETRKVPKLSLKLPKPGSYPEISNDDSDDSEKLTMEIEQLESENEAEADPVEELEDYEIDVENEDNANEDSKIEMNPDNSLLIAGADIAIIELELELPLDKFDIKILLQKCLKATSGICIYCNHARKIAVNGKQLGLHAIAEHRYSGVVNSITAEELIPESFVQRIKDSLEELEPVYFNLESSLSAEAVTFSHLFECFQCRFSTSVHKELYLHNRKLHAKNLLLCIMCKSNFYSYSELVCHLCPGIYVLDHDLQFRCCMCVSDDLPSAFRLMVHLRKRHHVCDVCLEMCHSQYRLSNHVWKHKLHHFCYRCCIAYRNKPDITRHLFWKHGTESVLCKKCLQKKWPHVYHFCVPPANFICEECNLMFSKAVALKVHKRIHAEEKPHACTEEGCEEKFISKKLLAKHELKHMEPPEEPEEEKQQEAPEPEEVKEDVKPVEEKVDEKPKPKVDVYDLPALNLSESDSSDSEDDKPNIVEKLTTDEKDTANKRLGEESNLSASTENIAEKSNVETEEKNEEIIQNIWDDFKNYQANKGKLDQFLGENQKGEELEPVTDEPIRDLTVDYALIDHDYCINPERKPDPSLIEVKPDLSMIQRVDHDYCSPKPEPVKVEPKPEEGIKSPKPRQRSKSSSSDSSSDSGSSCSCGSNCSCSSSSGSSSSSSDSSESDSSTEEGRRRQRAQKEQRREKNRLNKKQMKSEKAAKAEEVKVAEKLAVVPVAETPILESDLETTESETDEEFYDKRPQLLAKKILEEKRNQLLAEVGSFPPNGGFIESTSRPPTPPSFLEAAPKKKKSKSKKRKKKKSERREYLATLQQRNIPTMSPYYLQTQSPKLENYGTPTVAPITLSISRNSPILTATANVAPSMSPYTIRTPLRTPSHHETTPVGLMRSDSTETNLRASKRRRVPNKFYGYSSDEEEKAHTPKWRKTEAPLTPKTPLTVPPITIKTNYTPRTPITSHLPPIAPISIRTTPGDMRVHTRIPPIRLAPPPRLPLAAVADRDSATESNDSDIDDTPSPPIHSSGPPAPQPGQVQLYCFCQCPYDEVSEMIGCDSNDCQIEWFHFECVGIMVPPKGQWYCPDCRKKKQQARGYMV